MITVQASGRRLIGHRGPQCMEVQDGNDDGLAYLADAMTAVVAIVSHAKNKYGPIVADMLILTIQKAIDEGREKANV